MEENKKVIMEEDDRASSKMVDNNPDNIISEYVYKVFGGLPKQLRNHEYRFILLYPWQKVPCETDWPALKPEDLKKYKSETEYNEQEPYYKPNLDIHNYKFDDPYFVKKCKEGYNSGIICNDTGPKVFDCDNVERLTELGVMQKIPKTFTVKTQSGNLHKYLNIKGIKNKIILYDPEYYHDVTDKKGNIHNEPDHLGEIQCGNVQAVCPNSIFREIDKSKLHKDGKGKPILPKNPDQQSYRDYFKGPRKTYEVVDDSPIAVITFEELKDIIKDLKLSSRPKIERKNFKEYDSENEGLASEIGLKIEDLIDINDLYYISEDEYQGPHPIHGSENGMNFAVNLKDQIWCCFRHKDEEFTSGGDAINLAAVKFGIIDCSQSVRGFWSTEEGKKKYVELMNVLKEMGYDIPEYNNGDSRKTVIIGPNLAKNIEESLNILSEYNKENNSEIFVRSGELCRIKQIDEERVIIDNFDKYSLRTELSKAINYIEIKGEESLEKKPPMDIAQGILANKGFEFPYLNGITNTPTIREDGTILCKPGYDPATKVYYIPKKDLVVPEFPKNPTQEDAIEAANFIKEELLKDFPFVDNASLDNAIAAFLSPIVRTMIDGCIPIYLVDKPSPGTGATKLMDLISIIAIGRNAPISSPPEDEAEWRKSIFSSMKDGAPIICYDNIDSDLKAPTLARTLTETYVKDRTLGKSESPEYPQRACWYANGNNLSLNGDIPRRAYFSRLDAKMAQPWTRSGFKHKNIIGWTKKNRGIILSKLLIIASAWIKAGRPKGVDRVIGGFDEWVEIVGGILIFSGCKDFLGNLDILYENVDEGMNEWQDFLTELYKIFSDRLFSSTDISSAIDEKKELLRVLPAKLDDKIRTGDKSNPKKIGKFLRKKLDVMCVNGLILNQEYDSHNKINMWRIRFVIQPKRAECAEAA